MLKLRRAIVLDAGSPGGGPEQELVIELDGDPRPARADVALVGSAQVGDEVIVNTQALDLGLGSGGFDIVHVNLSRGLEGGEDEDFARPDSRPNVMKLNYTSLQHTVQPVEELGGGGTISRNGAIPVGEERPADGALGRPVAVLALHGQLAAVAWAFAQAFPDSRLGYVQTAGGALPGGHSRTVRSLRERGLLAGHLTAGAAFGGEGEAITTIGALDHGLRARGWDAAICGPGPGIVGLSFAIRARRHGRARFRARRARARRADAAGRADVLRGPPRAPPRDLTPHAHRARPAA